MDLINELKERKELIYSLQNALNRRIEQLSQNKRRYLKDADMDLEKSMNEVFKRTIEQNGATKITIQCTKMQYYNIETRNACINEFAKTVRERRHLEETYTQILNRVYKKWNNYIDYLISQEKVEQERIELEKQKQQLEKEKLQLEKEKKWKWLIVFGIILWNILKWAFIIIFGVIILLFSVLLRVSPNAGIRKSKK